MAFDIKKSLGNIKKQLPKNGLFGIRIPKTNKTYLTIVIILLALFLGVNLTSFPANVDYVLSIVLGLFFVVTLVLWFPILSKYIYQDLLGASNAIADKKDREKLKSEIKSHQKLIRVMVGLLVAFIVFLTVMGVGIYKYKWEDKFTLGVSRVVPYPAAKVDKSFVTYHEYLENLNIMKKYQSEFKKVDFKSDEGKKVLDSIRKDTVDRLVEDKLVKAEAKRLKVSVSKAEVNDSFNELIKSNGGEKAFAEVLEKYYGLTPEQFKEDIYESRLLRQKLSDKYSTDDTVNADAKVRADEILAKVKSGEDFGELAKQYSQDTNAASGGDKGYFKKGANLPEIEAAAFSLKAGEISNVIKTVVGYEIIKVYDVKGDEVKASNILIKTKDFATWLEESKRSTKIKNYVD
jgi:foldase protein PrsA